ncbi:MAG: carbon monoxide dehydrogenase [Methanomassiliicoccus sp.]|nr:carbon monoxide dehydrogenase [Methanomassiliicoccus sp.]
MNEQIIGTTSNLTAHDRIDHLQARLGLNRMGHKVVPGLYSLGTPDQRSPVLVSANYTLSFNALRSSLAGTDCYILVLDTKGVNVWCAAGKGTFGTEELVHRIQVTGLERVVEHRQLILPQLGAPGVAAHQVKKSTGFSVSYGPIRASDLQEYMREGKASPEMRRVTFPWRDRAVLTLVEVKLSLKYLIPLSIILFFIAGILGVLVAVVAVLGGTVLFPLLLPHLPTRDLSSKGLILGALLSLPFIAWLAYDGSVNALALALLILALLLIMSPVVGYMALNFTGCTTYTSRTGVKKEIFRWVPVMVAMLIVGLSMLSISGAMYWGWL